MIIRELQVRSINPARILCRSVVVPQSRSNLQTGWQHTQTPILLLPLVQRLISILASFVKPLHGYKKPGWNGFSDYLLSPGGFLRDTLKLSLHFFFTELKIYTNIKLQSIVKPEICMQIMENGKLIIFSERKR